MPRLRRLEDLLPHIREGRYRLGPHAAKHMLQEGFREQDILSALLWGRELAIYPEDERMLVLGYMVFPPRLRLPLHVVLEYSTPRHVDIVTAFIPGSPTGSTPGPGSPLSCALTGPWKRCAGPGPSTSTLPGTKRWLWGAQAQSGQRP